MRVFRKDDAVHSDVVFTARHVGAPGLAHGGVVATACDDLFGFLLYVVGEPAVTGSLQVDYHSPAVLGTTYSIWARLERRDGRRLHMHATGTDPSGRLCFEASAVFIVVPLAHFHRYGSPEAISHVFANPSTIPAADTDEPELVKGQPLP
ncbi:MULTISPECIES: PaaI family thioesterase [Pseudonocardia]|nr:MULTISPECIES: PaaI family thioesterase [Pseudonocardia]NYG05366.1 acyl-coenzyme A thioesterase PaaI-like protein [Pseudonocardia antarctica]